MSHTARTPSLVALIATVVAGCQAPVTDDGAAARSLAEAESCRPCHAAIVASYLGTAHFASTAVADTATVHGSFAPGQNVLQTANPAIAFTMERRPDGLWQTARDTVFDLSRSERFGVVVGSGRKGQSYLFWASGVLVQLPVSWLAAPDRWINSPGYQDGQVDFDRIIPPRCLECHSTAFRVEQVPTGLRYADDYQLGISCQKCHGPGAEHVTWHTANPGASKAHAIYQPAVAPRQQQLDACAVCHGGPLKLTQPAFSYRPGARFDDHFARLPEPDSVVPDVHGNQVALLERSACFTASPAMTCATCHDVHQAERDPVAMAGKCLACHDAAAHPGASTLSDRLMRECVDCHMPSRPSMALQLRGAGAAIRYRTHAIAIYPTEARR